MDFREDILRLGSFPTTTSRNMSSSSSAFFSANQSPFFSPGSPAGPMSNSDRLEGSRGSISLSTKSCSSSLGLADPQALDMNIRGILSDMSAVSPAGPLDEAEKVEDICLGRQEKLKRQDRRSPLTPSSVSLSSNRLRSCDVFVGLHGRKSSILCFANWLRAELEIQGMSCFISDRSRCRNSRKREVIERAMDISTFGVIILTRKSFRNPYTIEELRFFSSKKNLVPIYFDLGPADCLVRDIVEKKGELWEKHGGELWVLYGGLEKEWTEAVNGLSRVDEWKLEAGEGNWRDCILRAVTLLAMRLGRRSVVERLNKWREKVEKEEFPFPRNENFIGRKKELSELEFILFGDVSGDSERDYFELRARPRRKSLTIGRNKGVLSDERRKEKGKEAVVWKESEKEIEMHGMELSHVENRPKPKTVQKFARRRRSTKILYGKGIACVSGESGIGKTELLLEFAYRYHQRYKMVLWIGGQSRYVRQNYLNLWSFLEVDVGIENGIGKSRIRSFEEHEDSAVLRVRKELMRNIPFLIVIDNLETEKDWWDHKLVMELLPRFGGETHIIISTQLPRVMNMEPLKLSYLSGVEAMQLMQGALTDNHSLAEIDALRTIEEKLGRLTLGLAIVGSILSELPINPSRLLDTINRMPLRDITWNSREGNSLRRNTFLLQLFEVCFSIFDHADGPRSLATRMVQASGWFAPAPVPIPVLTIAAHKIPEKHHSTQCWKKLLHSLTCGCGSSYAKKSEAEAISMLLRFNIARSNTKQGFVYFNDLIKLYARKRATVGASEAMVQAVLNRGSVYDHAEHMWAACFLTLGFGTDPIIVELEVSDLLYFVKEVALPLAVRSFITFSRCGPAMELLRRCTDALEAADQAFVTPVEKWLDRSICWIRPVRTEAQLNPCLWQDLALLRATVLETRAKLMLRGAQFDIADDLIRKAIYIRTSICGEDHQLTVSARETLSKITRLLANAQISSSP
ncbi:uncharacterized protein LOC116215421 [Punica granatum]|uniref:Uncharacterized protein LOC116215421 n=2 Tax=Punica granatum TaxID=22663 RepID=A0A6P8EPB6_PUNGR|nr:uncharacterized protein LOC116215421 [Punica granatum]XP_031406998.1 uncharacterized protein LOC116215421 [Punica granatum]XP_031407008.1 uncharacterized protein LOC116215421 [Punica granatum]PKI54018.1 hypothetical protein CRG98_025629 [Punica granatum]